MTQRARPLVAGNWKMNGLVASLGEVTAMGEGYSTDLRDRVDLLVCPPATLLQAAVRAGQGTGLAFGGQDCHLADSGAHTGDVSAAMLADAGAAAVIVGHSERRQNHGEDDATVRAKAEAARRAGLTAIVCVGETEDERRAGSTLERVGRQLDGSIPDGAHSDALVVAYEPVWAIGTGLTPTATDIAEVHAFLRERLVVRLGSGAYAVRLLYGGSVKPANAAELMAIGNVDGALVGGASLNAADFLEIAAAYLHMSNQHAGGEGWH